MYFCYLLFYLRGKHLGSCQMRRTLKSVHGAIAVDAKLTWMILRVSLVKQKQVYFSAHLNGY